VKDKEPTKGYLKNIHDKGVYRNTTINMLKKPAYATVFGPKTDPAEPSPPLISSSVASPGANKTPTSLAPSTSISSGERISFDSSSQDGRSSLSGIELLTEIGTSKIV